MTPRKSAWVIVTPIGTYYRIEHCGALSCTYFLSEAAMFATRHAAMSHKQYVAKEGLGKWYVRGDRPMRIVLEEKP